MELMNTVGLGGLIGCSMTNVQVILEPVALLITSDYIINYHNILNFKSTQDTQEHSPS